MITKVSPSRLSSFFFMFSACALFPAVGWAQVTNTFTQSTTSSQSVIYSGDGTQRFFTQLETLGTQPTGFEFGFNKAFGDSTVQSALTAARKVLSDAGVPKAIANQGPLRLARVLTASGQAGVVINSTTATTITTETRIGPATVFIGNNRTTPFLVLDGTVNFNTNTDTLITITRTRRGTLLSERYVFPVDFGAVLSLSQSGLPVALVQREALLSIEKVATRDINGRLFRLRAESGQENVPLRTDAAFSGKDRKEMTEIFVIETNPARWELFASGHFGQVDQEQERSEVGFGSETLAGTVGLELRVAPGLTLGLAGT